MGRADRGAGEPGPASEAAYLAGPPPGAWALIAPPPCGPGPTRLPAYGARRGIIVVEKEGQEEETGG